MSKVPGKLESIGDDWQELVAQLKLALGSIIRYEDIIWAVPLPRMPVTTRISIFLLGDTYKPSFATGILGGGTTQDIISYW